MKLAQAQRASVLPGSLQAFPYKAFKNSIAAWTSRCCEMTVEGCGSCSSSHQRQTQPASCQRELLRMLSVQLQRLNAALVQHEEELVIGWHELQEQLKSAASVENAGMAGVQVRLQQLLQQLVNFHGDAVMLLHWSQVNFSAVMKALKHFDGHMGTSLHGALAQLVINQPFCCTEVITSLTSSAEQGVEQVTARMHQLSLALTSGTSATNAAAPAADTALAPVSATSGNATGAADAPAAMTALSYDRISAPSACVAFMRQSTGLSMSDCAYNRLSACPGTTDFTRMSGDADQASASAFTAACNTFAPCQSVKGAGACTSACITAAPAPAQPSAVAPTAACTVAGTGTSADQSHDSGDAAEVASMHMSEELLQLYDDIDCCECGQHEEWQEWEGHGDGKCENNGAADSVACPEDVHLDCELESSAHHQPRTAPAPVKLQLHSTRVPEVPAGAEAPEGWLVPAADPLAMCLGMSRHIRTALDVWGKLTTNVSSRSTAIRPSASLVTLSDMAGRCCGGCLPEATLSAPLTMARVPERTVSERSGGSGGCGSACSALSEPACIRMRTSHSSYSGWQESHLSVLSDA